MRCATARMTAGSAWSRSRWPGGRAVATVRFVVSTVRVVVSLDLVATRSGRRVDDVHGRDMPSLVSLLEGRAASP